MDEKMKNNGRIYSRILKLRETIENDKIDAFLIVNKENCYYLSEFTGGDAFLLISREKLMLISDSRYEEQAKNEASSYDVIITKTNLIEETSKIISDYKFERIGFIKPEITYEDYIELLSKLSDKTKLVPYKNIILEQRAVKNPYEIDIVKRAVEVADGAFENVLKFIKPGVTENEIALEIEYYMRKNGSSGTSFPTIVASGARSALPHGTATDKKIELGDAVLMDYGALTDNYCSDITRTVFLGKPSEEMKKIHDIVYKAQITSEQSAFEGLAGKEIDAIARNIIEKEGYADNFNHSLGHGVGLQVHEQPRLSRLAGQKMENGMVVTIEPGIYLKGVGGVRIEDMIIINGKNPEILTKSTKQMIII